MEVITTKLLKIKYEPKAVIKFTKADVQALMELSAHHYDGVCRSLSRPGPGAIIWALTFGGEIRDEDVESYPLRFQEVDSMAKCCEMAGLAKNNAGAELYQRLRQVLIGLNAEHERLNGPDGDGATV